MHASDGTTSKHFAFDVDAHDDSDATRAENREIVGRLRQTLRTAGVNPLVEDSDGRGSYHVWAVLDAPVPTWDVFTFIDDIRTSLGITTEIFPKQGVIPAGRFGNWLRLPGRHHTLAHWSRVAKDGRWLAGEEAALALLSQPLTPASVIPPAPPPTLPPQSEGFEVELPEDRAAIIRAYMAKVPHGGVGSDRSKKAFMVSRLLRHLKVEADEALAVLNAWNAGNAPPINNAKLLETWANSERYANTPMQLRVFAPSSARLTLGSSARQSSGDPFAGRHREVASL